MKKGRPEKKEEMTVLQIRIPKKLKEEFEERLKEDIIYESISQFIRAKIREYLNESKRNNK
ncbi:hypothetical protein [Persephonella sp.]